MNRFRLRSLGKKEPDIMGDPHGAADFVMVNPAPPPSNVAASSASTTSHRPPSETSSATPSATSRITSIMRTVTSPRFSQIASPFVTTGPVTSGTPTIASTLRIHHGAVGPGTVANGSPTLVFAHVTEVLQGMGLEIQRESEFKWRCVRSKREKLGGFDVMVGSGTAGSGGVDKRGLPVPSHLHTSAGGMLRGFLMRRTTSQSSSNPSPSSRQQTNNTVNGNMPYDGEGDSSLLSDLFMSMASTTMASSDHASPTSSTLYGGRSVDQGDEVRFSVELTRLDRLNDTLSLDIRRLKGNLRTYKFLYDTLRDHCAFVQ